MVKSIFFPLAAAGLCPAAALYGATIPSDSKTAEGNGNRQRPNIVLIMCDDMGFSDLGCYGSEIRTPNIDALASRGLRFSQFKNTARSCPSRASLLTGMYQHDVDMGWMTAVDEHRPGYRGEIAADVPTIAEVLKTGGYSTYMSGKWHVTLEEHFDKPNGSYPVQRGFDRYYGCLSGGGSYWTPTPVYNDLERVTELPDDYYYTTAITDSASVFISRHDTSAPMFMYVAYYAPHLPLQAPQERIEKCLDRYECGYDVLRERRFEKQKAIGLIPQDAVLPEFDTEFRGRRPSWNELTEEDRKQWTRDMATYAAMIEIMDDGVGKIVSSLKEKDMLDNTVIIFLSDNGATLEGGRLGQLMADLSNTPYRSYKQWCYQGGTSTPFIITWGDPSRNPLKGGFCRQTAHITDILPTCMDIAGTVYPGNGRNISLPGVSVIPAVSGKKIEERDIFFEHQSSCAVISGNWKLVRNSKETPWELYDLSSDPFETSDLSAEHPAKAEKLRRKWEAWASDHHVFPLENLPWGERIRHYKEKSNSR